MTRDDHACSLTAVGNYRLYRNGKKTVLFVYTPQSPHKTKDTNGIQICANV